MPFLEGNELLVYDDIVFEMDSRAHRFALARQRDLEISPYPLEDDLSMLGDDDELDDAVNAPWFATKSPFPEDVLSHTLEDDIFDPRPQETCGSRLQ